MLRSHLLDFKYMVGRHTGLMVGKDMVETIETFNIQNKVQHLYKSILFSPFLLQLGFVVADNVSVNDVAVGYVCKTVKPNKKKLVQKDVRGR